MQWKVQQVWQTLIYQRFLQIQSDCPKLLSVFETSVITIKLQVEAHLEI